MREDGDRPDRAGAVLWGLALVVLGVVFLLEQQHILRWSVWMVWWPGVVVAIGLHQVFTARTARRFGEGVQNILMGAWFFIATTAWMGITWFRSWPLAFVAIGMGMVARAIAAGWLPSGEKEGTVRDAAQ